MCIRDRIWEVRNPSPLLNLRLFLTRDFRYSVAIRVLGFMGRSGSVLLLPVYLLSIRGLREGVIGLLMLAAAAVPRRLARCPAP